MTNLAEGNEDGFSLIEVIVVLAIVSLMASFVFVLISQFHAISAKTDMIVDQAALQKTANYIAKLLESAEPVPINAEVEPKLSFIDGKVHVVAFKAVVSRGVSHLGFAKITLKSDSAGITEFVAPVTAGSTDTQNSSYEISPPGIEMTFSYLGPIEIGRSEDRWSDVWHEEQMPRAIEISLTQVKADKRVISVKTIADLGR